MQIGERSLLPTAATRLASRLASRAAHKLAAACVKLAGSLRLWHMSIMSTKNTRPIRAKKVLAALRARYPHPHTHLDAETAWQLLVATVLAAVWLRCSPATCSHRPRADRATGGALTCNWPPLASTALP